jgi:hypothetical protein
MGVDVLIHIFLISALLEVSGQLQIPARIPPGKEPPVPFFSFFADVSIQVTNNIYNSYMNVNYECKKKNV